jgi:hypothetical protein
MTKATEIQFGGTHYKGMGIQPIEFAMANQWDAGAFSCLKYLARHTLKNGLEDVQKGRHFVELREQFIEHVAKPVIVIPMQTFIDANGITGDTGWALMHLNRWVYDGHAHDRDQLLTLCDTIIKEYETAALPLR